MQIVLAVLITLLFSSKFWAQPAVDSSRPALRVFTDRDGLPQNSVEQIATDAKKYVWIVTRDGSAFYNGHRWRRVDMPDKGVSNWPRTLLAASDGSLWFGTESNGIHVLKDGKWTSYGLKDGLPSVRITRLYEGHSSGNGLVVWAGTASGLGRYEAGRWQSYTTADGLPSNIVRAVLETQNNTLLVGTSKGLAQIQGGRVSVLLPEYSINSLRESLSATGERTIWVGTYGAGIHYLVNGRWHSYNTQNGLPSNFIRDTIDLEWNGQRTLWVATEGAGLLRMQSGKWVRYETRHGLPSNYTFCFHLYKSGNAPAILWIGTLNGLLRMREGSWDSYDSSTGLPENSVVSLLETPETIWFGTTSGGLARLQAGKWSYESAKTALGHNSAFAMVQQGSKVLVGTEGGLVAQEGNGWRKLISSDEVPNRASVSCLLETVDSDGERVLWVGWFYGGLTRIKNGNRTHYTTANGLPDDRIEGLLETRLSNGRQIVWAATDGGLVKFEGERMEVFNRSHGLPSAEVRSLHFSEGRYLWVGTGGGVSRTDLVAGDGKWYTLTDTTTPPLPNNVVYQIREDNKGRIYFFTNRGVARLSRDESGNFSIYTYTTEDGLPSNECNFGASMIDSRGRIWAGTVGGAAVMDLNTERVDKEPKPLYIESAQVWQNGSLQQLIDGQVLAYDSNNFLFEYALLSLFREGDTRYRTQLLGYDGRLSEWNTDTKKEYTNLDAGKYVFQVWGRDYAGNITGPVSIRFAIRPAPWKTWWAYTSYLLLTVSGGYALVRVRLRQMRQREQKLESIVQERTSELVRQRNAIEEINTRFMESISYAERIQMSILPHQDELSEGLADYFVVFKPKDIVSGDFYWLQQIDGLTVIALADCTGHGVPGAIMSMMGVNLLDQIVVEKRLISPARILEQIHKDIRKGLRQDISGAKAMDGMDIGVCCIDPKQRRLTYAGAKRNLYYSESTGVFHEIKGDRYSIGGLQKEERRGFTDHTLSITQEQTFYMVTDGFADQQDSRSHKFGSRRLKTLLASISNLPLDKQRERLLQALSEHQADEPQRDDITILGFKPKLL